MISCKASNERPRASMLQWQYVWRLPVLHSSTYPDLRLLTSRGLSTTPFFEKQGLATFEISSQFNNGWAQNQCLCGRGRGTALSPKRFWSPGATRSASLGNEVCSNTLRCESFALADGLLQNRHVLAESTKFSFTMSSNTVVAFPER